MIVFPAAWYCRRDGKISKLDELGGYLKELLGKNKFKRKI